MTHVAKIAVQGNVVYIGREKTKDAARAAERAARDEYHRTGRVERARGVYGPQEWFDHHFSNEKLISEQRLMVDVLYSAVKDLSDRSSHVRHTAILWFNSEDRSYLYAFATICDEFGLSIVSARQDVLGGIAPRRGGLMRVLRSRSRVVVLFVAFAAGVVTAPRQRTEPVEEMRRSA